MCWSAVTTTSGRPPTPGHVAGVSSGVASPVVPRRGRAGAAPGDVDGGCGGHGPDRTEGQLGHPAATEAWCGGGELGLVRVEVVGARAARVVEATDCEVGLQRVVPSVARVAEVVVVQIEDALAITTLQICQRLLQLRPVALVVHRVGDRRVEHTLRDVGAIRVDRDGRGIDLFCKCVVGTFGVATVVERARRSRAALGEERRERRLETGGLLDVLLQIANGRVNGTVDDRGADRGGEQRCPGGAQFAAIAEPEVRDLLLTEGGADGIHVAS